MDEGRGTMAKTKGGRRIKRQHKTERERTKISHRISQDRSIDIFITSSTYIYRIILIKIHEFNAKKLNVWSI